MNIDESKLVDFVNNDYKKYPDAVKRYLSTAVIRFAKNLMTEVETCESPIELLMGIALNQVFEKSIANMVDDYLIIPQEKIVCNDKKYRVDFLIVIRNNEKTLSFVIECDGHDFHEKTKEQAKKDKKRDRDLMLLGYLVIRFAGSEIFENPDSCAREVVNIIITQLEEASE